MAKKKTKVKFKPAPPEVTFNEVVTNAVVTVEDGVLEIKSRVSGAQDLGADAMFVCAVEALHGARARRSVGGYLNAAIYAVVAALQTANVWNTLFVSPKPSSEQAESGEGVEG